MTLLNYLGGLGIRAKVLGEGVPPPSPCPFGPFRTIPKVAGPVRWFIGDFSTPLKHEPPNPVAVRKWSGEWRRGGKVLETHFVFFP